MRRSRGTAAVIALGIAAIVLTGCATARVSPRSALSPADVALYARVLAATDARRPDTATIGAAPEVPPKATVPVKLPDIAETEAPGAAISCLTLLTSKRGPRETLRAGAT